MKLLMSVISLMLFFTIVTNLQAAMQENNPGDVYIEVPVTGPEEVDKLIELGVQIEANAFVNNIVEGLISNRNLEKIAENGFNFKILEKANQKTYVPDNYYDFEELREQFNEWLEKYPSLTKYDTIGYSAGNNPVWIFRVSGSPDTAARQRIYFSGATHGNEKIGTQVLMEIATFVLTNYETDNEVKELVDRSEFYFHPAVCPDGFIADKRSLNSGKDPNRAFGFQVGGGSGSWPYEWPSLKAYRRTMLDAPRYISFEYHSGLVSLLKPFFTDLNEDLDRDAYSTVSKLYPLSKISEPVMSRQGHGLSMDCPYAKHGTISFLPEVSQTKQPENFVTVTDYNHDCIMNVIKEMQKGICGRVKCSKTGIPLYARVQIENKSVSAAYSDPRSGAYFKYLPSPSGTYTVTVFSNGFKPMTSTVEAISGTFASLDFELEYDETLKYGAMSVDAVRTYGGMSHSELYNCLQTHDDKGTTIKGGSDSAYIDLEFGPMTLITDQEGDDLTVYSTNNDNYSVRVALDFDDLDKSGHFLGEGQGTASFDLSNSDVDSARFVRIISNNTSPCIDAVEANPIIGLVKTKDIPSNPLMDKLKAIEIFNYSGLKNGITIKAYIPKGKFKVIIYDLKGKLVCTLADSNAKTAGYKSFLWHKSNSAASGTYLFNIKTSKGSSVVKAPCM